MTTHKATGLEVVVGVKVIPPYSIEVTFSDGSARRVTLAPAEFGPIFQPLVDPAFFAKVRVDDEAGTVVWPNGADLAPEFLYESGEEIKCPSSD
jgi:hypothetical protein